MVLTVYLAVEPKLTGELHNAGTPRLSTSPTVGPRESNCRSMRLANVLLTGKQLPYRGAAVRAQWPKPSISMGQISWAGGDLIDELNAVLAAADDADDKRRMLTVPTVLVSIGRSGRILLHPVPDEALDTAPTVTPRIGRYAQAMVRRNRSACRPGLSGIGCG